MTAFAAVAACLLAAGQDVPVETLRDLADRFDRAQIEQNRAAMEAMTAPDLVFVGSDGRRQDRAAFIAGWMDPGTRYQPIQVTDRYILPLGPDAGVVGGDVVVRGTSNGRPFAVRIRFSDTFRRTAGQWRAVHIQATRVPEPATTP
ncbi:MAG TPA: nuclear transport factor 2 family protein [Allosphingosinicella sp.]|nr:nuclear transport factor 2 family protein [Allosphingosinicella sp.]